MYMCTKTTRLGYKVVGWNFLQGDVINIITDVMNISCSAAVSYGEILRFCSNYYCSDIAFESACFSVCGRACFVC